MKKRLAVIIMLLTMMFSGCSAALSEEEYYSRFVENYSAYNQKIMSLSVQCGELGSGYDGYDWDSFEDDLKSARESLDAIEKMSPPETYSALHRDVCEKMQAEREWCDAAAKVAEDKELSDENAKRITDAANASQFHSAVFSLIKQMKDDGVA